LPTHLCTLMPLIQSTLRPWWREQSPLHRFYIDFGGLCALSHTLWHGGLQGSDLAFVAGVALTQCAASLGGRTKRQISEDEPACEQVELAAMQKRYNKGRFLGRWGPTPESQAPPPVCLLCPRPTIMGHTHKCMGRPLKDLPPARDDSRRRLCDLHAPRGGVPWRWPLPLPRFPPPSDYQPPFRQLACALPCPVLIHGAVPTSGVPSGNATRQWICSQTKRFVKTQHHARRTKVLSQLMYLCRAARPGVPLLP